MEKFNKNWSGDPCNGEENWRFNKQLNLAAHNPSTEKTLEKTIAGITDENWANQVPTASGINGRPNQHHLDLVHREGRDYTFYELKVAGEPLLAAFQILRYGIVYTFSQENRDALYPHYTAPILEANQVHLAVLAPPTFYNDVINSDSLHRLEQCLNNGLREFAKEHPHSPRSFRFEVFPQDFQWKAGDQYDQYARDRLSQALEDRAPLFK